MQPIPIRTPTDIGALLKDRRRALGLDQAELAERIGVSRLWVNQVEGGKPGASLGLILRALEALGVQIAATTASAEQSRRDDRATEPVTGPDINLIVANARKAARP
jgi:HTH-type transcriptional regulator/antitoxin HipB